MVTPYITPNVKYNSVALLVGYNQVFFFTQRYSISFLLIFHTFCPYLESLTCFHGKDLIVQTSYVHLKDRKQGGSKLMFMPFEIVNICVWLWYFFSETCRTAACSHLYK